MKSVATLFCSILLSLSFAQDFPRKDFNLEKLSDEIFPIQDRDLNYEELYENLAQLLSRPLDLNTVSREQLRALMLMNEKEINSFLKFREENAPLLSVYELQSVPAWNRITFDKVIPFVTVHDSQSRLDQSIIHRIAKEENAYLLFRVERGFEEKAGYKPETDSAHRFLGSPEKFYLRYRVARSNDFSLGFTMEKDQGEPMNWSPPQKLFGFDYLSFHAQVLNKGHLKNLVVGDFQTQFGQGLILGSVFGFGKNSETITTVRRSNLGFLPYTSLNENNFSRGIAGSITLSRNLFFHGFFSHTSKDAVTVTQEDDSSVSSLLNSGLHRTQKEIETRKQIGESGFGGVLQFKGRNLDAGMIISQTIFDKPFQRNPGAYNQFAFRGSQNLNLGIFLNYSFANFTFFSEIAHTWQQGLAVTAGILGSISRKAELALLMRSFSKDFHSFSANAFSENSLPQNEKGMYWGLKYQFNKYYSLSGYVDLFRFPWLRYRGYAPSEGNEWLIRFNYSPSRNVLIFLQAREESKIRNLGNENNLYHYATGTKRNFWINVDYDATRHLSFKIKAQFSSYNLADNTSYGFAIIQDINLSLGRWLVALRYALMDTDDYDNRLYFYERDVWLGYSFPAYEGVGARNYVLVQYKLSSKIDLWIRWSHVRYTDRDEIGSGSETMDGNMRNDGKFQVRIRF